MKMTKSVGEWVKIVDNMNETSAGDSYRWAAARRIDEAIEGTRPGKPDGKLDPDQSLTIDVDEDAIKPRRKSA